MGNRFFMSKAYILFIKADRLFIAGRKGLLGPVSRVLMRKKGEAAGRTEGQAVGQTTGEAMGSTTGEVVRRTCDGSPGGVREIEKKKKRTHSSVAGATQCVMYVNNIHNVMYVNNIHIYIDIDI